MVVLRVISAISHEQFRDDVGTHVFKQRLEFIDIRPRPGAAVGRQDQVRVTIHNDGKFAESSIGGGLLEVWRAGPTLDEVSAGVI